MPFLIDLVSFGAFFMSINRVLTDFDRENLQLVCLEMQRMWPELFSRKISDSMVQFAYLYNYCNNKFYSKDVAILLAGSHEDIVGECLRYNGFHTVGIDPAINCDLHTFVQRNPKYRVSVVLSASVLEHTENDEEFIADSCSLLIPGGYGVFSMDFKADWHPGQPVPYTSRRFYTPSDLTERLRGVLKTHGCDLVEEPDYTAKDRFVWDGINYSFATWIFRKNG